MIDRRLAWLSALRLAFFESSLATSASVPPSSQIRTLTVSRSNRDRSRLAKLEHLVEDVARAQRLGFLRTRRTSTKPIPDDRLVSE